MTVAATPPKPSLCENLTINFTQVASSHNTVGTIWRVAAIVCAVAVATLLLFLFISQFSAPASLLESTLLFGSSITLTALAINLIWKGGTDEFAQSEFYAQVDRKRISLQESWERTEIEGFFTEHNLQFPPEQATIDLLKEKVLTDQDPSLAFLPTIAHFMILQENLPPVRLGEEYIIANAQRGLHQLNQAMILQTLHRPTENRSMHLSSRLVDRIDHVGSFDMPGLLKKMYEKKSTEAFFFEKKEKNDKNEQVREPLTLDLLNRLKPEEIRALIFD